MFRGPEKTYVRCKRPFLRSVVALGRNRRTLMASRRTMAASTTFYRKHQVVRDANRIADQDWNRRHVFSEIFPLQRNCSEKLRCIYSKKVEQFQRIVDKMQQSVMFCARTCDRWCPCLSLKLFRNRRRMKTLRNIRRFDDHVRRKWTKFRAAPVAILKGKKAIDRRAKTSRISKFTREKLFDVIFGTTVG